MPWFKVDDGFSTSRKVLRIPRTHRLPAVGLWMMAGSWAARELSDGIVPKYVLDELGATPRLISALVEVGLWVDHGVLKPRSSVGEALVKRRPSLGDTNRYIEFKNWADYQPTREQVEDEREKTAERQRKWRERRKQETRDESVSNTVSNAVTNTVSNAVSNDAPTRPVPAEVPKGTSGVPRKRGTRIPDPFIVTPDMRQWAAEKTPLVNVDRSTEKFVNYWRAKSGKDATKLDWLRTWRNWLLSDQERAEFRGPGAPRRLTNAEQALMDMRMEVNGGQVGGQEALDSGFGN